MSINYRKKKLAMISYSKRRIILAMYENSVQYFPSLREIRDELIEGQMYHIRLDSKDWTDSLNFKALKSMYKSKWSLLFDLGDLGDLDKPLTPKILSNPNHPVTKHLLQIYSMESFIYKELNQASRAKDQAKLKYYGAFAASLSYIIYYANNNRRDKDRISGTTLLYRGLQLGEDEITQYWVGAKVHLMGYTSTSLDQDIAIKFATQSQDFSRSSSKGKEPVVFRIQFRGSQGLFKLSDGFSHYAEESEVLV